MKKLALLFIGLMFVAFYKVYPQQTVSDEDNRYSIDIPAGWVHASSKNAVVHVLMCCNAVTPNERLTITYTRGSLGSLSKVDSDHKKSMKKLKNFKLEQEGDGMLGGEECKWFVFTTEGDDGSIKKGRHYTIKPNRIFIFQYLVPEKRFDEVKDDFEKIISTFKLIN